MAIPAVARPLPPSHVAAVELLRTHARSCVKIVRVDPDAILFVGAQGKATTCWLWVDKKLKLVVRFEMGFPAWPAPGLFPVEEIENEQSAS